MHRSKKTIQSYQICFTLGSTGVTHMSKNSSNGGLSREQYKNLNEQDQRLMEFVLTSFDTYSEVVLADNKLLCEMMAKENFSILRCKGHSRTGSSPCRTCHFRYPLLKTSDFNSVVAAYWNRDNSNLDIKVNLLSLEFDEFNIMRLEQLEDAKKNKRRKVSSKQLVKKTEGGCVEMGTNKVKFGACAKCGQEKTLSAAGQCQRCRYGDWALLTKEDVAKLIEKGLGRARKVKTELEVKEEEILVKAKQDNPITSNKDVPVSADSKSSTTEIGSSPIGSNSISETFKPLQLPTAVGRISLMFGDEDSTILDKIYEASRRNRRSIEQEILFILSRGLNNTSSTKEEATINKVKTICQKMKNYPIPDGSPKEVFSKTLDTLILRLNELMED